MSVENLTASVGINCINVSWSYAETVESYVVSCGGVTKTVTEMSASFSAEELQITALDLPVSVNVGGTLTETTLSFLGWASYTVPSPVTDIGFAPTELKVLIYWNPPSEGGYSIQSYTIEMSQLVNSVYSEYQNIGTSEISNFYTPDLVPGSTYKFRIVAINLAGVSVATESADILIVTYPDSPLNIRFGDNPLVNNISILWDNPLNNGGSPIVSYVLYLYANKNMIYSTMIDYGINSLEYTSRLPRGAQIAFEIQSINSNHYSIAVRSNTIVFEPLPPSLRVHLSASEYVSGAWLDKTGNGNNASLTEGTVSKNAEGNGIVLDGQSYWTLPPLELPQWTVGVWFKETAPPQPGGCIITQIFQPDTINLLIGDIDRNSSYRASFYNSGFVGGPSITTNGWTNIQATYDGTTLTTYVNGVSIGSVEGTGSDSGIGYRIGRCWDVASYVTGEIGEVRMYNYPLTQVQVTADYNASASTFLGITPPVEPPAIPNEPIDIRVTPGIASSLVSWTPSPLNAFLSSPVTGYKIFCIPDNKLPNLAAADATSLLVTNLKNGTPYSFRVHAINANGMSVTSSGVVPSPPPAAPKVVALRGPGDSVLLTVAGKPQKGSPILHYNFSVDPPAPLAVIPTNVAANSTFGASASITGLTLGTSYVVSATATSPTGTSLPGSAKPVIAADLPDAPVIGGLFGIKSVQLSWSTPDGKGLPIIGYNISYSTGTAAPILVKAKAVNLQMIKGLVPGSEYTFSMQAINVKGISVSSNSLTLIPT